MRCGCRWGPQTGTRDGHRVVEGNVSQGRAGQPGSRDEEQDAREVGLGGAAKETRIQVCKLTWLARRADGQEDPGEEPAAPTRRQGRETRKPNGSA